MPQIDEEEDAKLVEEGTAAEVATYLIISAAQVGGAGAAAGAGAGAGSRQRGHWQLHWQELQHWQASDRDNSSSWGSRSSRYAGRSNSYMAAGWRAQKSCTEVELHSTSTARAHNLCSSHGVCARWMRSSGTSSATLHRKAPWFVLLHPCSMPP